MEEKLLAKLPAKSQYKPLFKLKTKTHLSSLPQSLPAGHKICDNFSLLDFASLLDSKK